MKLLSLSILTIMFQLTFVHCTGHGDKILLRVLQLMQNNIEYVRKLANSVDYELGNLTETLFAPPSCPKGATNGVHNLVPAYSFITAYCHYDNRDDKGWIAIHRRINGTLSFDRSWNDYRNGFGDLHGEYWLGLERIHRITRTGPYELMILLEDNDGIEMRAKYDRFRIAGELEQYQLELGRFSGGSLGDHLAVHNGMKFSAADWDNDLRAGTELFKCEWWFSDCHKTIRSNRNDTQNAKIMWNRKPVREAKLLIRVLET